jgi:putative thioredoxin
MNIINAPKPPPAAAPSDLIKESGAAHFIADVMDASNDVPVIVDFWAPWCGPCKQLTPILEKAVKDAGGKIRLVKINIDQNQELAGHLRIQSIPAVFVFYRGQPIDGFSGALPESQIKQFVEHIARVTGGEPDAQDAVNMLAQAETFMEAGKLDHAEALYREILRVTPDDPNAHIGMIKATLAGGKVKEAKALIEAAPAPAKALKEWSSLIAGLELAEKVAAAGPADALKSKMESNPADHQARYDYAMALYATDAKEEAMDQLIEIVRRDRKWNEELARKELLRMFDALGVASPLTIAARRKLSSVMFA